MGYFKNKEQSLHEYKSDLALVRKLQLHFRFSNVPAHIWDSQNVTLCFMHISTLLTWRTRSSAATSFPCTAVWGRACATHGKKLSSKATAGSQLAANLLHRCHHSSTSGECKLEHGTSFLSWIRVILSGKRLAVKQGWVLLWLVLPGSSLAFSNLQIPGTRMVNAPRDFPFPRFVQVVLAYLVVRKHELHGLDPQKPGTLHRYLCQGNMSAEKI